MVADAQEDFSTVAGMSGAGGAGGGRKKADNGLARELDLERDVEEVPDAPPTGGEVDMADGDMAEEDFVDEDDGEEDEEDGEAPPPPPPPPAGPDTSLRVRALL